MMETKKYFTIIKNSFILMITLSFIKSVVSVGSDGDPGEEPDLVPHGYNKRETGLHDSALDVELTIWVESIIRIDLSAMEFIAQCYMNHEWQDVRLKRPGHHTVIMNDPKVIWTPDTYCVNCREEKKQPDRVLIKIDVEGRVYYSQLALLYVSCIMNLEDFPFDVQTCTIKFASYSLNNSFIRLKWHDKGLMINEIILDQFTVSKTTKMKQYMVAYLQGNFTILEGELFFTRQIGYYIIQFFVPSSCLVFLSWITFYMCTDDVSNRIGIGVTLILTMIFLLGYVNATLPKVSYIKAIDWYVIISLAMIIFSVLESVLVYWILNSDGSSRPMGKGRHDMYNDMAHHNPRRKVLNNGQYNGHGVQLELIQRKKSHYKKKKNFSTFDDYRDKTRERLRKSKIIDIVARVIFPLAFISFNIYFVLIHSD